MKKIITATLLLELSLFANGLFAQEMSADQIKAFQTDSPDTFKQAFNENDLTKCFQVKGKSYSPLSLSVKNDKRNIFNFLVRKIDVNKPCNGITPLMEAGISGNMDAAKNLIKFGAKKDTKDNSGKTAKDHALANKKSNIALIL